MTNSDDIGPTGLSVDGPDDGTSDETTVEQPPSRPGKFHIQIDRKDYELTDDQLTEGALTGSQLRQLAEPPIGPDRDLFEIVPGGSDRKIENTDRVRIRNGMRFFSAPSTINPGLTDCVVPRQGIGVCMGQE